ncbi:uncharacterized protein J4E79_010965 [Alternaria viburni]|uniref:uncharacterized protein n=1 Tax=Alternaria viburni TaxID=566460 RepID=UPI0020C1EECE|nr:uncharacterized protein J4E79_010965 [Alternaria viburni]KAI4644830.1 hypothetical protein J4E79_010965 [Alternaria viburni]
MAKSKRGLKSLPTSLPIKKERLKELQDSGAVLDEAFPGQAYSFQHVPQGLAQDPQDVPCSPCTRDQISISNAVNSPLLRLPAEIRNTIFAYVYTKTMHYIDHKPGTTYFYLPLCSVLDSDQLSSESKLDRIPLVCRQVHTEMALLPYALGTFDFLSAAGEGFQGLWALKRYLEG